MVNGVKGGWGLAVVVGARWSGGEWHLQTQGAVPLDGRGGGLIAFQSERHGADNEELYVMNADGSGQTRLTFSAGRDVSPALSPDRSRIAFSSNRTGDYELYVMDLDGSNLIRLTTSPQWDLHPSWSPDGSSIVFMSARDGDNELFIMSADGTTLTQLTENSWDDQLPDWSPQGDEILFTSRESGSNGLYVVSVDGTRKRIILDGPDHEMMGRWRPRRHGLRVRRRSGRSLRHSSYQPGVEMDGVGIQCSCAVSPSRTGGTGLCRARRTARTRRGSVNLRKWIGSVMTGLLAAGVWAGAYGSEEPSPVFATDTLRIPYGSRATIDGQLSAGEWEEANTVRFSFANVVGDSVRVNVSLMHDGGSLRVAYRLEAPYEAVWYAPELFIDTDNDRSISLRADDWWFHVSGSDCAAAGRYDDYSTCTLSADWETGPTPANRGDGSRLHTVEICIPFAKLGVTQGADIGLAFRVEHSARISGEWVHRMVLWPSGASADSPATWKIAQLVPPDSR